VSVTTVCLIIYNNLLKLHLKSKVQTLLSFPTPNDGIITRNVKEDRPTEDKAKARRLRPSPRNRPSKLRLRPRSVKFGLKINAKHRGIMFRYLTVTMAKT